MKCGQQLRQRGDWIHNRAAEHTGVQIHFRTGYFQLKRRDTAQPITHSWHTARDHSGIRDNCHVTFERVPIFAEKRTQIRTANFLFPFDHQMQIHRQLTMLLDRFLNSENVRKNLAFVVRGATRKNVAVLQHRLERRRVPKFQRIRRLHVVMAVNQNRRMTGSVFIAGPHNGMPFRGYKLRLQADLVELVHQPVCTFDQFFLVLIVSRNARKPQERIILLKMIIAHAPELRPTATNREPVVESRSGPHASGPYREGVPLSSQCTRASPFIVDRQRAGQSEQNARAPPHQRTNTWF